MREWLATSPDATPCNLATLVEFLGRAYAACREDGLLIIAMQPAPALVQRRNLGGSVVDLFESGGALAAKVLRAETQWVGGVAEAPPPVVVAPPPPAAPATPPPAPPRKLVGRVIRIQGERRLVDLGTVDGISERDNIQFFTTDPDGEERVLAVGPVRATSEHRALVELGLNEEAPIDTPARLTTDPISASRAAPPRTEAPFTAALMLRPFVGLSNGGGGVLIDASLVHRFRAPFKIGAAIEPFGYGGAAGNSTTTLSGMVFGTYDSKGFEAGLGLGVQTVNDNQLNPPGTGTLMPLILRFGSADGANLHGRVDLTLFHREVLITGLRLELDVMIDRGIWLLLGGGGGESGYALGEVGVKKLLNGNGNRGSHYLTITAGGTAISRCSNSQFPDECGAIVDASGAHLGAGFESRF